MPNHFFEQPILNSPYAYPGRHWELDPNGQPTDRITEFRSVFNIDTNFDKLIQSCTCSSK